MTEDGWREEPMFWPTGNKKWHTITPRGAFELQCFPYHVTDYSIGIRFYFGDSSRLGEFGQDLPESWLRTCRRWLFRLLGKDAEESDVILVWSSLVERNTN